MNPHYQDLKAALARVRSRWRRAALLRGIGLAAGATGLLLAVSLGVYATTRPTDLALIVLAAVVLLGAVGCVACAAWTVGLAPNDRRVARFLEEQVPELEDRVATAVEFGGDPAGAQKPIVATLVTEAAARLRTLDFDRVVSRVALRRAALLAAAGLVLMLVGAVASRTPASRALDAAAFYAFPSRTVLEVRPGHTKVMAGDSLQINVHVRGASEVVTPVVEIDARSGPSTSAVVSGFSRTSALGAGVSRTLPMAPTGQKDEFLLTLDEVEEPFTYRVAAGLLNSPAFNVRVLRPPHIKRIDLSYEYPSALGLKNRVEQDSGDIYAPAGTTVRMRILTDKPVASGEIVMGSGSRRTLAARSSDLFEAAVTIEEDGSYRIALADVDGIRNPGDTEYFIRTLEDRPPDVRIIRPVGDLEVTPLQEVTIEARAEDDHGIAQLELVFAVRGSREQVVPLRKGPSGLMAAGAHTLYLEDLRVQPGDFVTYFARARDVGRGRKSTEVRSDIFFLEVKPFDEEFVAAQSQSGAGTSERSLEELAQAQKDIIVATWKLDRRALDGKSGRSQQDILQVARAQGELQDRTRLTASDMRLSTAGGLGAGRGVSRGATSPDGNPVVEALARASIAMGRARGELEALNTSSATPHEMEALNEILKALAETRRRQVSRSQQANASGGSNRAQRDLSTLFDRELRRQQETNYERPAQTEQKKDVEQSEALDNVRELARRQAELTGEQRDLANKREQLAEEELRRQLERLTREQADLRQQAEELARALSRTSQGGRSGSGQNLREIGEQMRQAANDLRRSDPQQASQSSNKALDKLNELEHEMRAGAPGSGDPESKKLANQLAQAQRTREQMGDVQARIDRLMQQIQRLRGEQGQKPNARRGDDSKDGPQGNADKIAKLQEELQTALGQARELLSQLGRAEGGGFGVTPEGQQLSRSAAGLESYKQDFGKWDSLKKDINLALERFEVSLARKMTEKDSRDRLNAGADSRVPRAYRDFVDKYYRSLAKK